MGQVSWNPSLGENKDPFIVHGQYNGCRWPGNTRSQSISSHGIDLVLLEYFSFDTRWVKPLSLQCRGRRNGRPIVRKAILALSDEWLSLATRPMDEQIIIAQMSFIHLGQVDIWFRTSVDAMLLVRRTSASQISRQPLQWRHNEHDGVSNHQPHHCLLKHLFGCRSKKTSKLLVTGLCVGNSPVTGEFPAQMASNAENASIWWRHHGVLVMPYVT